MGWRRGFALWDEEMKGWDMGFMVDISIWMIMIIMTSMICCLTL